MSTIDFQHITSQTPLYNFHTHTQFCDGRDAMESFAKEAARANFRYIGFSPHSPIPIESPCNMKKADVALYLDEIERLRRKYPLVTFYSGMEIDYLGPQWGPDHEYFQTLGLDYSIGSVHFIPNQEGKYIDIDGKYERFARNMEDYFHNDLRYVVEKFYEQNIKMVRAGKFDIIGHLDKVGHNASQHEPHVEDTPWYMEALHALVDEIINAGIVVEINTKAFEESGRIFPAEHIVGRLLNARVPMIVNSDAHYAPRLNSGRNYGLRLL